MPPWYKGPPLISYWVWAPFLSLPSSFLPLALNLFVNVFELHPSIWSSSVFQESPHSSFNHFFLTSSDSRTLSSTHHSQDGGRQEEDDDAEAG